MVKQIRQAMRYFQEDNASLMAAAISFYAIFAIGPLFLLLIALGGMVIDEQNIRVEIIGIISQYFGDRTAETAAVLIKGARSRMQHTLGAIFGFALVAFSGVRIFVRLQQAVERIWQIKSSRRMPLYQLLLDYLLALGLFLFLFLSMLLMFMLSFAMQSMQTMSAEFHFLTLYVAPVLHSLFTWAFVGLVFAALFRSLPHTKVEWRLVAMPAILCSFTLAIGSRVLSIYLNQFFVESLYGAFSSMILLILWIYCISLIFMFGVELCRVRHDERQSGLTDS